VGCGPGSLTLLLAPHVADSIGVDADADMLAEAPRLGASLPNVRWVHLRAEELPSDLPAVDVVTFAQSFHWMDRPRVAAVVRRMLRPRGAVVHVGATTHEGVDPDGDLPFPRPPRDVVARLVERYLGPVRRAGQGVLPSGTSGGEDDVFRAAGFVGPERIEVPGRVVERSVEEVASSFYSLSSSAPHLFGARLAEFDGELRALLVEASDGGRFSEQLRSITLSVWR
jgi:SAM-dependent methyltransferase